jgi:hypothetical protein
LADGFKQVEFFKYKFEFNSRAYREVINSLSLKQQPSGRVLFNYGDKGDFFYVMLQGSVSIRIPNP